MLHYLEIPQLEFISAVFCNISGTSVSFAYVRPNFFLNFANVLIILT